MDTPNQIQGLPAGFTVDSDNSEPSTSQTPQVQGLPSGFTVDDTTPGPPSSNPKAPFQGSTGTTYTPGMAVQHSDGTHGEVDSQHPDTGNAVVKWHVPDAKSFKQGQIVNINGEPSTIQGYTNNGKVLVEGKWGSFGKTRAVSPADIDPPSMGQSAASGLAGSMLKTATGAAHVFGGHPQGLENAQAATQATQDVNPASGKAGELAGDLVQFLAANGIVKAGTGMVAALPAAEQYAQASKIVKVLADHPILARLLHAGINGAGVGGGMGYVQSGGSGTAAAEGAAGGALGDVGGEFAGDAIQAGKDAIGKAGSLIGRGVAKTGELAGDAADYLKNPGEIPGRLYPDKINVPDAATKDELLQPHYDAHNQQIADAITKSLKDEGIDLPAVNDIRKVPQNAADLLVKEAGYKYAKVDAEIEAKTGRPGRYQETDQNIADLKRKIRDEIGDPEKQDKLTEQLNTQIAQQKKNMQIINDAGLGDEARDAARLTKKSHAMLELKDAVKNTTRDKGGELTQTNPDDFLKHLHNMDNDLTYGKDGRLTQALGKQHATQLVADTKAASKNVLATKRGFVATQKAARDVLAQRAATRKVGYGLAAGGLATAAGAGIHGALEH
jgi:hypothetical protein